MCDFLLSRERTYMYFLNKKTKSAIHRWGFVWVYYYYKWGFGCFSAVRVHVWPSRWPCSEWCFWLVNFKVTISSQTLSLNQLLHVFWALTLKCLLSHMMLIQIPWPTQELITSHIQRQLHNLGRGRRSFKPYPKQALFSQTSQSKMQKITLDVDLKMALLLLEKTVNTQNHCFECLGSLSLHDKHQIHLLYFAS